MQRSFGRLEPSSLLLPLFQSSSQAGKAAYILRDLFRIYARAAATALAAAEASSTSMMCQWLTNIQKENKKVLSLS